MHIPVWVHQGDADTLVNPDYTRYGVRLLERWGFDVRCREMPGYGHEEMNVMSSVVDWFLQHRRAKNPSHVRLRSAELRNASAYWVQIDQKARPTQFMVVDAEIVRPNTIRLDSQNVLAMTLTPGSQLIDPAKHVTVVWNGQALDVRMQSGAIKLAAPGYSEGSLEKNSQLPGEIGDVFNTPFAVVIGTSASDPAMREMCLRKANALIDFWKLWQAQPPRVFKDSELSDKDAAQYSLILIGGPDANLAAKRLAGSIPLTIGSDHVSIGERSFPVSDARVQVVYPNPLNSKRYLLLVAATSPAGMSMWVPNGLKEESSEGPAFAMSHFDFTIEDARIPDGKDNVPASSLRVAGGWFDHQWKVKDAFVFPGDADLRSKSAGLQFDRKIDAKLLESYAGKYEIRPEVVVQISKNGDRLQGRFIGQDWIFDLTPLNDERFYVIDGPIEFIFQKDAAGAVVGFKEYRNGSEFTGKKIE